MSSGGGVSELRGRVPEPQVAQLDGKIRGVLPGDDSQGDRMADGGLLRGGVRGASTVPVCGHAANGDEARDEDEPESDDQEDNHVRLSI
jgi:hypothetical protein